MNTHEIASPYNTGERLEPLPWVRDGLTGTAEPRPSELDDDEGTTIATVHIEGEAQRPEDVFVMKIDGVNAPLVIHGPGGEYIATIQPH
ncbi:hypothetical protein [Microbacterium sp. p3-SID131]|uniref:hypothetical protein n=1 Tax=Microbacterium sp. p3-SID131 TaxID=2916215 RepID=UPI0021A34D02|nr:hypothetical protein [Microbacterium sp. p3-SID131]MCT1365788.1 hypothetical protein [Microbacterium sp. p3-SID131]